MSNQDMKLYTYNAGRAGVESVGPITGSATVNADYSSLIDGRQSEILYATQDLVTSAFFLKFLLEQNALSDAIDTVIISGHNLNGAFITANTIPSADDLVNPNQEIIEANRETILVPLSPAVNPADTRFQIFFVTTGPADAIVPEVTEIFVTTAHTIKRPEPGWDHGYRQAQQRFESQSGVSSTWLLGRSRKLYRFTWDNLTGADLTILENLRPQTNDFTEPFWLQPPDDSFPLVMVEIDRDADWQQMFEAPLASGLGHRVTLPLIEVAA